MLFESLACFSGTSITKTTPDDLNITEIQTAIAPLLQTHELQGSGMGVSVSNGNFVFYSFYYQEEQVMRFAFENYNVKSMPEDHYFECNYNDYVNFFNQIKNE